MPKKEKEKGKEEQKTIRKIIFCGLDNSGKSSFIARLKNQAYPLNPTPGIERTQYEIFGYPILIWDFGGQSKLRTSYPKQAHFFNGTDLLFYMIDIQDEARFDESLNYFKELVEVFEEKPLIFILFHKADPDITESQKVKRNIELIKEKLKLSLKHFTTFFASTTIFDFISVLTPFSFALSKLLPFAAVLDSYIFNFLEQQQLGGIILMDKYGAILSKVSGKPEELALCELTGTHLTLLFEAYEKKSIAPPDISLQLAGGTKENPTGIILFHRIEINKNRYYLTILARKLDKIQALKDSLTEFVSGLAKTIELSLQ